METLHCTNYDDMLLNQIVHLKNYPQLMPFVGARYNDTKEKILLIGESHYIPGSELKELKESHLTDWYNNTSNNFYEGLGDYINTRKVINKADKVGEYKFAKPLSIYYNTKSAIKGYFEQYKDEPHIFPYLSFYNYFQRPAFVEGSSIKNDQRDNEIAYNTFKAFTTTIQPNKIIFCSTKAWNAFCSSRHLDTNKIINENCIIDYTCHPGTAYWNMLVKKYGNRSGYERFLYILGKSL